MDDVYTSISIMIENSLDGIIVADTENMSIVMANSIIKNWLGYTNEEFVSLVLSDLHPKEIKEYIILQYNEFGRGSTNFIRELPTVRKDGSIFYADLSGVLYTLPGRKLVLGFFKDITPRLLAEKELRASEKRFQLLFEQAAMGVALVETETGYFLNANKKFSQITGYSIEELSRMTMYQITHPEDKAQDRNLIDQLLDGSISEYHIEKRYIRKDGIVIWVRVSASTMWEEEEELFSHIAIIEDISERKQIENQLAASEEFLKCVYDTVNDSILVMDSAAMKVISVNEKAVEMFGYSQKDWYKLELIDVSANRDEQAVEKSLWHFGQVKNGGIHIFEWYIKKKNGEKFWAEVNISSGHVGSREMFFIVVRDIQERKQADEKLQESEERFKLFMEYLPAAAYIKDQDGRALFANKFLDVNFGAKEWIGKDARDLFPGNAGKMMYEADMKALEIGYEKVIESLLTMDSKIHVFKTQKFRIPRINKPALLGGISIEISENQIDTEKKIPEQ